MGIFVADNIIINNNIFRAKSTDIVISKYKSRVSGSISIKIGVIVCVALIHIYYCWNRVVVRKVRNIMWIIGELFIIHIFHYYTFIPPVPNGVQLVIGMGGIKPILLGNWVIKESVVISPGIASIIVINPGITSIIVKNHRMSSKEVSPISSLG